MTSGPTYSGNAASASIDLSTLGGPALESGKTFSPPVIGAIVVSGLVGCAFMWAFMSGANQRQLLEIQQADAIKLRDAVKPKVAAFNELNEKIGKLSGNNPDFTLAEDLAKTEFAVGGAILAGVTIPLPGVATDNVANYAADTTQLKAMLSDHKRYTTGVDKEELEKLMQDNKAVAENAGFGIVIDPKTIAENYEKDGYSPQMGKLVGFKKFDEKTKKVDIAILPAGDVRQVDIKQFIPIDKAQILKAGGQNAMQRYSFRVRNIKFQANKISQYTTNLLDSLEMAAGGEGGSAPAPAAEEKPAEAPAEAPAE